MPNPETGDGSGAGAVDSGATDLPAGVAGPSDGDPGAVGDDSSGAQGSDAAPVPVSDGAGTGVGSDGAPIGNGILGDQLASAEQRQRPIADVAASMAAADKFSTAYDDTVIYRDAGTEYDDEQLAFKVLALSHDFGETAEQVTARATDYIDWIRGNVRQPSSGPSAS